MQQVRKQFQPKLNTLQPFFAQVLHSKYGKAAPHVMYLCGADRLVTCGPSTLRQFGCICCSRPGFTKELERVLSARTSRHVHIVDDDELLTTALDSISSTKIRKRMLAKKSIAAYVAEPVAAYIEAENLAARIQAGKGWDGM